MSRVWSIKLSPSSKPSSRVPPITSAFDMFHDIIVSFNGKGLAPALRYNHLTRSAQVDAVKIADLPRLGD